MSLDPYNVDAEISSLCATGLRPNIVTGIVLHLLIRHFSDEKYIKEPQLKSFIWSNDAKLSKILIVPVWRWMIPGAQKRPALLVKRNALQPRTLGLGDGQAILPDLSETNIPADGESSSQVAMLGSHTVFAISENAAQVELLATEVYSRLIQYAQAIQNEFLFNRFRVAEIGAVSKLEEHSESFVVPITLAYAYIDAWKIPSVAPFLKRVAFETSY